MDKDELLLKKIEKAAQKGALKGTGFSSIISNVIAVVIIAIIVIAVGSKFNKTMEQFTTFEDSVESRDMVIDDNGFLGYTAVDFAEAILGKESQLKKLEVYSIDVSDVATITKTGLGKVKAFTKCQLITYKGKAIYTVDLGELKQSDITLNEESKTVTIKIPHAVLEPISIPTDQIEFGDTQKGLLAFGDIKLTVEESNQVQEEAQNRILNKLDEENVIENADRFAILSVWELYQPLVKSVSPEYGLEVIFK